MVIIGSKSAIAILITLFLIFIGCGGGNRVFSNRGGEVVRGKLMLDSVPERKPDGLYKIGHGDKIDVLFLYNEEFSRQAIGVRPDGRISYPFIGEVSAAGRTVPELDSILTEKFSEIILNPDITIVLAEFQPQLVYVLGEVKSPGGFPIEKGGSLLKALALGNGLTDKAKKTGVLVIRRIAADHVVGMQIDLKELLDGHNYGLDIPLEPFDIVMVPKSKVAKAEDFATALNKILKGPMDVYLRGWQVANVNILYDFYKKVGRE